MVANMRRASLTIALLLVLALAVPASAATWRTYGTVRAGGGGETSASTAAADVEDIQLGIYTYGTARTMRWAGYWDCWSGANISSREKAGTVTTRSRAWTWINVRASRTRTDVCEFRGRAYPADYTGRHKIKLRVR